MENVYNVLYVDDESTLLDISKIFLEKEGMFAVDGLTSATEALERIKTRRYDAIISDYQMPEMNGIDFLKTLRACGDTTPFIIFTGRGREEIIILALNEGADFYLQKGVDLKSQYTELAHKINQAVARKRGEKALAESEERYRSVVNDQTELIARFTPDGIITFANEAYRSYFAPLIDLPEVIGKNIRDVMQVSDCAEMKKFIGSLTRHTPIREMEYVFEGKNSEKRWQVWSIRALFSTGGTPPEYQVVGRDITDRKQAENRLSEVNDAFLSFSPDPLNNINILTGLAGRMLQGTCALYNRLEKGLLCSLGMWNTPPDFAPCDQPEGHICNDVILKGGSSPTIINNLLDSHYAETDPNVRRYQLQTYVGIPVKIGEILSRFPLHCVPAQPFTLTAGPRGTFVHCTGYRH